MQLPLSGTQGVDTDTSSVLAGALLLVVPYLFQIRSRVDVIRHVVKNGLLWDDLYIGFQTRLQRDPDIYHHL